MEMMKFYRIEDLVKMTGLTRQCLSRYCKEGELPAVKRGRRWFVSEEALRKFFLPKELQEEK